MAKSKTRFVCTECGCESPKWQGQCPECGKWNTLVEEDVPEETPGANRYEKWAGGSDGDIIDLRDVQTRHQERISSGIGELDRVLGGGLVQGGVTLLGGDPGIGKSTLLLQVANHLAQTNQNVLYVSGEESPDQVALRAKRLNLDAGGVHLMSEISLQKIIRSVSKTNPAFVVIDSIQTIYSEELNPAPGSITQVRECSSHLTRLAKQKGISIFIIGHVTKEGSIAGPRVLEHMVDTVLYFEGDSQSNFRMIRAIKNRFGSANELGIFAMNENGLQGVNNPSMIFLSSYRDNVAGSVVLVTMEGTRPLLVEVQALVDTNQYGNPKRLTLGLDQNRLSMLLAVLNRHAGIACNDQDVFINAVGGVKILEPAADLAMLLAIISSFSDKPLPKRTVVFGEVGLLGEVRPVAKGQIRLKEAVKLGFERAIVPNANLPRKGREFEGITVYGVKDMGEAVQIMRDLGGE